MAVDATSRAASEHTTGKNPQLGFYPWPAGRPRQAPGLAAVPGAGLVHGGIVAGTHDAEDVAAGQDGHIGFTQPLTANFFPSFTDMFSLNRSSKTP